MIEDRYVLGQKIKFFLFGAGEIGHIMHHDLQVIIIVVVFFIEQVSAELKRSGLYVQYLVYRNLISRT